LLGLRSKTNAAATATAQSGATVMTNGRIVSLAEWEFRSNNWKTSTLPKMSAANATATPATFRAISQVTVMITV
jgi:hypothetical protein